MRHYEIVFMVHPDYGDQILDIVNRYIEMITCAGGKIHRLENWGRRQLAYAIKKFNKAYYILLNVEIIQNTLDKLSNDFKFNEIVLRNIIIRMRHAVVDPSPMISKKDDNQEHSIDGLYQKKSKI